MDECEPWQTGYRCAHRRIAAAFLRVQCRVPLVESVRNIERILLVQSHITSILCSTWMRDCSWESFHWSCSSCRRPSFMWSSSFARVSWKSEVAFSSLFPILSKWPEFWIFLGQSASGCALAYLPFPAHGSLVHVPSPPDGSYLPKFQGILSVRMTKNDTPKT